MSGHGEGNGWNCYLWGGGMGTDDPQVTDVYCEAARFANWPGDYETHWDCCQACAEQLAALFSGNDPWGRSPAEGLSSEVGGCSGVQNTNKWACGESRCYGPPENGSVEGYETEQICLDSCSQWYCWDGCRSAYGCGEDSSPSTCMELSLSETQGQWWYDEETGAQPPMPWSYDSREECEADDSPGGCSYVVPPARWRCTVQPYPDAGFPGDGRLSTNETCVECLSPSNQCPHASEEECEASGAEPKPQWSCVEPEPGEGKRCAEVPAGEGVAGETYYQSLETCEDDCGNECAIEKTFQIKKGQTYVIEVDTNSVDKFNHKDHWWEIGFYKKTTETETTTTGGVGCRCERIDHGVDPITGLPTLGVGYQCMGIDRVDPHTGLTLIVGSYGTSEECENDCTGEFHEECVVAPIETQTTETVTYNPAWSISTESITNCPWGRCSIYPADLPLRVTESLDEVIRSLLTSDNGTPYAMAAVMVGGELLYSNYLNAGYVEALSSEPMGRTASIGKAVCGAAIGTLYDKGLLSPTDKLVELLPEHFYNSNGEKLFIDDRYEQITVEHLTSMQGGWNRGISEPDVLGHSFEGGDDPMFMDFHIASDLSQMFPDEYPSGIELPIELKHIIRWETQRVLDFTPGTGNANASNGEYSNYGFALLAEIIGKKTGQRYDVYIKNTIFDPLGIRLIQMVDKESTGPNADPNLWPFANWGLAFDPWEGYCNKFGCWNDDNGARFMGEATVPYYNSIPRFGYGDLLSTASDYVKFLTLFENTESSNKILSAATKELMFRRPYGVDEGAYYAYGQSIYGTDDSGYTSSDFVPVDGRYAEHSGYVSGSTTMFQRHINTRLTSKFCDLPINIVVFLNKSSGVGAGSGEMANAIENALWDLALEIESEES